MKVVIKDQTLAALRDKEIRERNKGNENGALLARACHEIIRLMPEQDVQDGVQCGQCYWYDKDKKRCLHNNGLQGRVRPQFYCCYGSPCREDTQTEVDETAFAEFDEEGGEDE